MFWSRQRRAQRAALDAAHAVVETGYLSETYDGPDGLLSNSFDICKWCYRTDGHEKNCELDRLERALEVLEAVNHGKTTG